MDVKGMAEALLARADGDLSPGQQILDLLQDPFSSSVSSAYHHGQYSILMIMLDCGQLHLGFSRYIHRLHSSHCDSLFLSPTIQFRRLCPKTQTCRRQTRPSSDGKGHVCLVHTSDEDQGTRIDPCHRHGCNDISAIHEDVEEHVLSDCNSGLLHTHTDQLKFEHQPRFQQPDVHNYPNDANKHLGFAKLGIGDLCMDISGHNRGVAVVELQEGSYSQTTVL